MTVKEYEMAIQIEMLSRQVADLIKSLAAKCVELDELKKPKEEAKQE